MNQLTVEDRKIILQGRLDQLSRMYYDASVDAEIAKAVSDTAQLSRTNERLATIEQSFNAVQAMMDALSTQPAV